MNRELDRIPMALFGVSEDDIITVDDIDDSDPPENI
jgi:hypothetical protein